MTTAHAAALAYCAEHGLPSTVGEETESGDASDSSYVVAFKEGWERALEWKAGNPDEWALETELREGQ